MMMKTMDEWEEFLEAHSNETSKVKESIIEKETTIAESEDTIEGIAYILDRFPDNEYLQIFRGDKESEERGRQEEICDKLHVALMVYALRSLDVAYLLTADKDDLADLLNRDINFSEGRIHAAKAIISKVLPYMHYVYV